MVRAAAATGLGSILLHVDAGAASALRLDVARSLAARHGASITALFAAVADNDRGYAYSAGAALDGPVARQWREGVVGNLQRAAQQPAQATERWFRVADTAAWMEDQDNFKDAGNPDLITGATYGVNARSVLILIED